MNRRPVSEEQFGSLEIEAVASKQLKTKLKERFLGGDFSDGQWRDRADLTLWYDQSDKLVRVEIENHEQNQYSEATGLELEQLFEKACEQNTLYQLSVPEHDIMTS